MGQSDRCRVDQINDWYQGHHFLLWESHWHQIMKSSKYPSDVEGVGIRGKENTWFGIVVPCQLGIVMCMYGAKIKEWRARSDKTSCSKHKPTPHKKTRKMGAIYFKRRRHMITSGELVMLCTDCVFHSMLDQAGKLFMCDETVWWQKTAPKGTERKHGVKHKDSL